MPDKAAKSSSPLLWVLLILLLGVGGYYYYMTYWAPNQEAAITSQPISLSTTDWASALLQRPDFLSLKSPIPLPFEVGPTGNSKPFVEVK